MRRVSNRWCCSRRFPQSDAEENGLVTIHNVEVTFEVEGDDQKVFQKYFAQAIACWWRDVKDKERAEEEGRQDRALMPPARR